MKMVSTIETGHAKNVAAFEDLISFCTGYGATYNPTKPELSLTILAAQLAAASAALQAVKVAKTTCDNATNAREMAFKPLKSLTTKVVNAFAAAGASKQTINDLKSSSFKIQGRRAKTVTQPDAKTLAEGAAPVKVNSTSQQSYDKLVDHFAQLITTLTAELKYQPNENELKLTSLNAMLIDLKAKNTEVINATTALSNARIARDQALYSTDNGIIDTALAVKSYIKSVFGATSPQFKQIGHVKFTRRKGD